MVESGKLKLIIPKFQREARLHLQDAGWTPVFDYGEPVDDDSSMSELDKGIIEETGDPIIKIRSRDIPRQISMGYADIGLVGSDCVSARASKQIVVLGSFEYGRKRNAPQPRVEICAHGNSTVSSIEEVKPGSIFMAETQHLRLIKEFLEERGFKVKREGVNAGPEFHQYLVENDAVGITQIGGSGPVLIDDEMYFAVMVNEEGQTVSEYGLNVIAKVCDIETLLIANINSLEDKTKRERILQLKEDLATAYEHRVQKEFEGLLVVGGKERDIGI